MTVAAGIGMGLMGERLAQRDVAIGMVLALSLGFGLLFLHFFTAFATACTMRPPVIAPGCTACLLFLRP